MIQTVACLCFGNINLHKTLFGPYWTKCCVNDISNELFLITMVCCVDLCCGLVLINHDDVIKWKHFPRYWPFVRGIYRSPVNSSHKGHWRGALMYSLICAWINGWVNDRVAGELRSHRPHYEVTVMFHIFPPGLFHWHRGQSLTIVPVRSNLEEYV